jgi:hypothetical protein
MTLVEACSCAFCCYYDDDGSLSVAELINGICYRIMNRYGISISVGYTTACSKLYMPVGSKPETAIFMNTMTAVRSPRVSFRNHLTRFKLSAGLTVFYKHERPIRQTASRPPNSARNSCSAFASPSIAPLSHIDENVGHLRRFC